VPQLSCHPLGGVLIFMKIFIINIILTIILTLVATLNSFAQQETQVPDISKVLPCITLDHSNHIIPISSVEYSNPTRVSFSFRFLHAFKDDSLFSKNRFINISLSPGLDGVRISAGWLGVWVGHGVISMEARLTVIRTWKNPISAGPNETYLGPELRMSPLFVIGIGYYFQINQSEKTKKSFFGFQIGLGI
jgi:hypothetical protein